MSNDQNSSIFEWSDEESPQNEWRGMPEFNQPNNSAYRQIIVSFDDEEGVKKFAQLVDQHLTSKTKSIWFPPRERNNVADLFWFDKNGDISE